MRQTLWFIHLCRLNGLRKGDKHPTYTPLGSVALYLLTLFIVPPQTPNILLVCAHAHTITYNDLSLTSHIKEVTIKMAIRGTYCHYFVLDTRQYSHGVDRSGRLHNSLRMRTRTYARCLIICNSFTYTSLPLHGTRLTRSYFKHTILPQYHISIR